MVTKCDLVAGFTEYFDDLTQEGRAQVWGVTFPLRADARRATRREAFPAEFDALIERLNERVVRAPRRRARRAAATQRLRLPAADGGAARAAPPFVTDVFAHDALRTAGAAARRLLHQRHAGRHADRSAAGRARPQLRRRRRTSSCQPAGRGKAYFVERLLKDVMSPSRAWPARTARSRCRRPRCSSARTRPMRSSPSLRRRRLIVSQQPQSRLPRTRRRAISRSIQEGAARDRRRAAQKRSLPRLDAVRAVVDSANSTGATSRGRCAGASIRATRSATPRATPTCANSTAAAAARRRALSSSASRRVRRPSRKSSTSP